MHERLEEIVRRHELNRWRKPVAGHTRAMFDRVQGLLSGQSRPLVLDSGCGTGASTFRLADRHPEHMVLGIDQSAARLLRQGVTDILTRDNLILLRAELADVWRLMLEAGWQVEHHYLLYPNPWPKPAHFQRRWHGHPVFPELLMLGGRIELRSNWEVYVREFARAMELLAGLQPELGILEAFDEALTPFERKYAESGHELWRLDSIHAVDYRCGFGHPQRLK